MRGLLVAVLEKGGYAVVASENGLEPAERLLGENFDLVVTDMDMPELAGLEFETLAIVLSTTSGGRDKAVAAGAVECTSSIQHGGVSLAMRRGASW